MASPTKTDLSTLLMVDSTSARDRDDAFAITPLAGARGRAVEVHIAPISLLGVA
ncbi:hypothetical protein [Rhodococcus sp. A14]|uniref:hypothetical protein n=1 Tax=Rhodococcus sp. A14 TaxID=1194106 RepID=UPI00142244F3|nr:hypothetical protein [Rhodococcus sp. A14]